MTKISSEKIKLLHPLMAEATGGSIGVRDESLLDSAVESAFATFDGVELYASGKRTQNRRFVPGKIASNLCRFSS